MKALGIDIGGTGIKGAVVDTKKGHLVTDRLRLLTPEPATPDAVAATRRLGRPATSTGTGPSGAPSRGW